ncbi:hypothetical protein C818_04042 [Lachnospiraceae bacterium MD308]|jgi:hypothetical protein|nr:hypothetical protein C818_04042 [Lachnospiraceae bacterium MD308]
MEIKKVTDDAFSAYGKVLEGYDFSELLEVMKDTPLPEDEVVYVPGVKAMEEATVSERLKKSAYGGLPIQVGYCNGHNLKLNALEYHRSSEVDIAASDLILLLGRQQDIQEDYTYDTAKVEGFFVPAKTAVELYATTLHYAPCQASEEGFRCVIVLPEGTNHELDFSVVSEGEEKLMTAKNKWLIAHEDAKIGGAFCGLKGENISLEQ